MVNVNKSLARNLNSVADRHVTLIAIIYQLTPDLWD